MMSGCVHLLRVAASCGSWCHLGSSACAHTKNKRVTTNDLWRRTQNMNILSLNSLVRTIMVGTLIGSAAVANAVTLRATEPTLWVLSGPIGTAIGTWDTVFNTSCMSATGDNPIPVGNGWSLEISAPRGSITYQTNCGTKILTPYLYAPSASRITGGQEYCPAAGAPVTWTMIPDVTYEATWVGGGGAPPSTPVYRWYMNANGQGVCEQIYPGKVPPPVDPVSCSISGSQLSVNLGTSSVGAPLGKQGKKTFSISCTGNASATLRLQGCKVINADGSCDVDVGRGVIGTLTFDDVNNGTWKVSKTLMFPRGITAVDVNYDFLSSVATVAGTYNASIVAGINYQ